MELLPLVCVSLLTWSGTTFAAENGQQVSVAVEEGADVILPCSLSTKENIENMIFDWKKDGQKEVFFYNKGDHYNNRLTGQDEQFKGRVFHFENELQYGNASIKVTNIKMNDNGTYSCTFPGKQKSHITLFVAPDPERFVLKDRTGENIPGAARKPFVTILQKTEDGMLLQCEVQGASYKPVVEWKDSDGNILPSKKTKDSDNDHHYDINLQTTVTKTDDYRCVATQKEISHQIYAAIYVPVEGSSTAWVVAAVLGTLLFLVIIGLVVLVRTGYITVIKKDGGADYKTSPEEEP